MPGNELFNVDTYIYGILAGDATLTALLASPTAIYRGKIRQDDPLPGVLFVLQSPGRDVMAIGTTRVLVTVYYQIKALGQGISYAPLAPIATRIDQLFHGNQNVFATAGHTIAVVRESALAYEDDDAGQEFRHLGGLYKFFVQPS